MFNLQNIDFIFTVNITKIELFDNFTANADDEILCNASYFDTTQNQQRK